MSQQLTESDGQASQKAKEMQHNAFMNKVHSDFATLILRGHILNTMQQKVQNP